MYIDENTIAEIRQRATLGAACERYLQEGRKKNTYICPMCGKEASLSVKKGVLKCFHCGEGWSQAENLVMSMDRCDWPTAMKKVADDFGVVIPESAEEDKWKPKARAQAESFCKRQLRESGLTRKDVEAKWHVGAEEKRLILFPPERTGDLGGDITFIGGPFYKGTVDKYGKVHAGGDDMIIQYLDLDGHPVTYRNRQRGQEGEDRPFFRVRWQYPESHPTAEGKQCKYKSPAGSGLHLYIPEAVRHAYRLASDGGSTGKVRDLFFTEGEKKAEAVSKWVGPAFGMGGINCLVGKEGRQLPEEVIRFVEAAGVERVFFIMDADWNALSGELTPDKDVTGRARQFASAAINFRDWFRTLTARNIFLDVYLVLGKGVAKGVDDQLAMMGGEQGRYRELIYRGADDAVAGGETDLFDVVKISAMPDAKVRELWHLNDPDDFTAAHIDQLSKMAEGFTIMKNLCRINSEGKRESVFGLLDDETFWTVTDRTDKYGNSHPSYSYNYERALHFLNRRGFWKQRTDSGEFMLVRVENREISEINETNIQDYVMEFVRGYKRDGVDKEEVLNMLHRAKSQYLGKYQMTSLFEHVPEYAVPQKDSQILMFRDRYWHVSADGVEEHDLSSAPFNYWAKDRRNQNATRVGRLVKVAERDGRLNVEIGDLGDRCDFLRFLVFTSWFDWEKHLDADRRPKPGVSPNPEHDEIALNLLAKMTAIGYLLHHYSNPAVAKAVIAMDEHISPVGDSQGRSGKSLISVALEQMSEVVTIAGKGVDLIGDRFVFEQVTSRTRVITIDDIEERFNFELLFPSITSGVTVNGKGLKRFTLNGHDKPKFLITTNHAVLGANGSTRDRQFKIAFSNFFDENYKPEHAFGRLFFSEDWDEEQWNLFYNLMAECLEVYFLAQKNHWGVAGSGLIEAPCDSLDKRLLRQMMTEGFYEWFVEYFQIDENNPLQVEGTRLLERIGRPVMFEDYLGVLSPAESKFIKAPKFRQRMLLACRYFGYALNPQLPQTEKGEPIGMDKVGGTEFYTVGPLKSFESGR